VSENQKKMVQKALQISIHVIAWTIFWLFPAIISGNYQGELISSNRLFYMGLMIVFFYLNYFIFIPKLLFKKRNLLYFVTIVLSIGFAYTLRYITHDYFHEEFRRNNNEQARGDKVGPPAFNPLDISPGIMGRPHPPNENEPEFNSSIQRRMSSMALSTVLFSFLLSTIIKVTQKWYLTEKQKNQITNEKLISELSFLKSQVNPHFLFNTLNGIYGLALQKSNETPKAILKLSGLMRHMLYESEESSVPLSSELDYLNNFIDLQKLRLSEESSVIFNVEGSIESKIIQPMLLIPFFENAFKHGQNRTGVDININIILKGTDLLLQISNKTSDSKVKDKSSGIGLKNVKKRLELLYPDAYNLKSWEKDGYYTTHLSLKLENE